MDLFFTLRRYRVLTVTGHARLLIALAAILAQGNALFATEEGPNGGPTLWVGETKRAIAIGLDDEKRFPEFAVDHLEDIAVDDLRSVVWIGTRKAVIQHDLSGRELYRYPLLPTATIAPHVPHSKGEDKPSKEGDDRRNDDTGRREVHLSIDPADGSLWIGTTGSVTRLSADRRTLFTVKTGGQVEDMSVDVADGSCWAGLKDRAVRYGTDGRVLMQVILENGNAVAAIAADPHDSGLWAGTKQGLIRFDKNGQEQFRIAEARDIVDLRLRYADGSLWAVTKRQVFRFDRSGKKLLQIMPCPPGQQDDDREHGKLNCVKDHDHSEDDNDDRSCRSVVTALAVNQAGGSAFVAWNKGLAEISTSGSVIRWFRDLKQIEAIDIGMPELSIRISVPADGASIDAPFTTVSGTVSDTTAKVIVNGREATVTGTAFEAAEVPLSLGTNTITAVGRNIARLTASDSVSVTRRLDLPPLSITIESPVSSATVSSARISVSGMVSEGNASVVVNEVPATVTGTVFTAPSVPLRIGDNTLTAVASDGSGRTASASVSITYPWLDLTLWDPMDGNYYEWDDVVYPSGSVTDPAASVLVNGVEAYVDSEGSFSGQGIRLRAGWNDVIAQAANPAGQTDTERASVFYKPFSPPPLGVSILSPGNDALIGSPLFEVAGVVSDPAAQVIVNDTLAEVRDGFYRALVHSCDPFTEAPVDSSWCVITVTAYTGDGRTVRTTARYTYDPVQDPLTVSFSYPAAGTAVTASPTVITGSFHDGLSHIQMPSVTVSGVPAEINGNTFRAEIALEDGRNAIQVTAVNLAGHSAFAAIPLYYEPQTRPLSVQVTSPPVGAIANRAAVAVSGIVNDDTATMSVNGLPASTRDYRSFFAPSVPLSPGENLLTVTALRRNGETAETSVRMVYDPAYPSPPAPQLAELPRYARTPACDVGGLTVSNGSVELLVNGAAQVRAPADAAGLFHATVPLPQEGANHIAAVALDPAGNRSEPSPSSVVIRDTVPPPLGNIFLNIDDLDLRASHVFVTGWTEPGAEVTISIDSDPAAVYRVLADTQGGFSPLIPMSAGNHIVTVHARDNAGNGSSNTRLRTVYDPTTSFLTGPSIIPPQLDPLPTPVNEPVITIEGNAYARFEVEVYRNDELMGTVRADSQGRFRLEGMSLVAGINRFRAKQVRSQIDLGPQTYFLKEAWSEETAVELSSGPVTRPRPVIDFPMNGSVTTARHVPLRGTLTSAGSILSWSATGINASCCSGPGGNAFASTSSLPLLPGWNTLWVAATATDGSRGMDKISVYYDHNADTPSVTISQPANDSMIYDLRTTATGTVGQSVRRLVVNDIETSLNSGLFSADADILFVGIGDGVNRFGNVISAWAMDEAGRIGYSESLVHYKYVPVPVITVTSHASGQVVNEPLTTLTVNASPADQVTVNGRSAWRSGTSFTFGLELKDGRNDLYIIATNGPKAAAHRLVLYYYPASQVTITSLSITPSPVVIGKGERMQAAATVTYSNGLTADVTTLVFWESSDYDTADVMTGKIVGLRQGQAVIFASYDSLSAEVPVTVGLEALQSVRVVYEKEVPGIGTVVVDDDPRLAPEEQVTLRVLGTYTTSEGATDLTYLCSWSSSNNAVATVDLWGRVTAHAYGEAVITASIAGRTATRTIRVAPPPVELFITSPADGRTIDKDGVTVRGYVFSSTQEVGVRVNGVPATVHGNEFVANRVPLGPTNGLITVSAVDTNGTTAEAKRTVTLTPSGNPLRMAASIESGTGPLETVLRIDGIPSWTTPDIGFTGPGTVEFIECTDPTSCKVRMTVEGIYTFTVTSPGYDGKTYSDKIAVTVVDKAKLDTLLKAKWERMTTAVLAGDVTTALNGFVENSKSRYQKILTHLINSNIAEAILSTITDVVLSSMNNVVAECWALRQEVDGAHAYPVTFTKGSNGLWKIMGY